MRLRALGLVATFALSLAAPLAVQAQERAKVWRIGYLQTGPAAGSRYRDAFRQGLREVGYVEGQNVVIEFRYAEGKPDRLDGLASELVRLKVDVIVTTGTQPTVAAKRATSVTPIVMALSGDAVGTGLVGSLARPGGNVTGLTYISTELAGKRLEILKEILPRLSRVAVLWNPEDPPRVLEYKESGIGREDARSRLAIGGDPPSGRDRRSLRGDDAPTCRGPHGLQRSPDEHLAPAHRGRRGEEWFAGECARAHDPAVAHAARG